MMHDEVDRFEGVPWKKKKKLPSRVGTSPLFQAAQWVKLSGTIHSGKIRVNSLFAFR